MQTIYLSRFNILKMFYLLAHEIIRPHVKELVQQILRILRESENDELTGTISKLVQSFTEEVASISLELVHTLVGILCFGIIFRKYFAAILLKSLLEILYVCRQTHSIIW